MDESIIDAFKEIAPLLPVSVRADLVAWWVTEAETLPLAQIAFNEGMDIVGPEQLAALSNNCINAAETLREWQSRGIIINWPIPD
jgi:hypothetical protein